MDRNTNFSPASLCDLVALRKESVDRNLKSRRNKNLYLMSLSARIAWIEIGVDFAEDWLNAVALRKESVDRNPSCIRRLAMSVGRSPQGERG